MGLTLRPPSRLPALAIIVALLVAACGPGGGGKSGLPASPLTDHLVAATVNSKPIYVDDVLAEAVARGAIKEGEDLDPQSPIFYQITEDLIETRLFAIEAESRGLDRDPEVKHRLEIARERILANVLNENIASTALKDSAIDRMYREQIKLLKSGQQVRISHILFESKEAALAAKRRLDEGELFVKLAYDLSKDRASAPDGGDLGFSALEALPDPIRNVVAGTDVGKVGGPVKTEEGWHLIKVDEKRDTAPPTLESMRPKIVQWLMFDEQRRVVDKLKSAARIARLTDQPPAGVAPRPGMETPEDKPSEEGDRPARDNGPRMGPGGAAASAAIPPPIAAPPVAPVAPAVTPKAAPQAAAPAKPLKPAKSAKAGTPTAKPTQQAPAKTPPAAGDTGLVPASPSDREL